MGAMGFYLRLGDATTCGGRILTGDETLSWYGVAGAREGDAVACGKHPGVYKILGGTSDTWDEGRRLAGTLDSVSSCPCCARFIPSIHDCYFKEDTSEEQAEEERLLAVAALAVKEKEPATKEKRLTEEQNQNRVFAKSRLREAGNTDAGTEDEPQSNFAAMSFISPAHRNLLLSQNNTHRPRRRRELHRLRHQNHQKKNHGLIK
ncbi:PAAR domain-containing protein [Serratia rubidaea]|nr:PAAR domain-containing protein [Serratia rubidaea]